MFYNCKKIIFKYFFVFFVIDDTFAFLSMTRFFGVFKQSPRGATKICARARFEAPLQPFFRSFFCCHLSLVFCTIRTFFTRINDNSYNFTHICVSCGLLAYCASQSVKRHKESSHLYLPRYASQRNGASGTTLL